VLKPEEKFAVSVLVICTQLIKAGST
jgi:hypothetical protein